MSLRKAARYSMAGMATGTPEEVATVEASYTGQYLKPLLARHEHRQKVASAR